MPGLANFQYSEDILLSFGLYKNWTNLSWINKAKFPDFNVCWTGLGVAKARHWINKFKDSNIWVFLLWGVSNNHIYKIITCLRANTLCNRFFRKRFIAWKNISWWWISTCCSLDCWKFTDHCLFNPLSSEREKPWQNRFGMINFAKMKFQIFRLEVIFLP